MDAHQLHGLLTATNLPGILPGSDNSTAARWQPREERDLIALCLALGVLDRPGALSAAERALLSRAGPLPTKKATRACQRAIRRGEDPLGEAFCTLRPPEARRRRGAFYTPPGIVDAMTSWVIDRSPERLVDAGCGSGRFTLAARRLGFDRACVAVDLDPLATLVARTSLHASGDSATVVVQGSFLDLELPRIEGSTAFVGNPPYVRHHALDPETKRWAKEAGARLGLNVSGLSGLHALFIIAAAEQSREDDLGCMITSSTWLDTGYGGAIRELLTGPLGCRSLHLLDPRSTTFDDAMTTAVVLTWRCGNEGSVEAVQASDRGEISLSQRGRAVARSTLRQARRWTPLFRNSSIRSQREPRVPLGSLVKVHRGVATGANKYFTMTPDEGERLGLTPYLRPCLDRASQVIVAEGVVRAGDCPHLLLDTSATANFDSALGEYIAKGESEGIARRYLCSHRKPWWRVGGSPPPPIVATYMARQPPTFALNPDDCRILNVLHGLYPKEDMGKEHIAALVTWLNDHRHELEGGRTYQGGLVKFEPRDLEELLVPPLELLL